MISNVITITLAALSTLAFAVAVTEDPWELESQEVLVENLECPVGTRFNRLGKKCVIKQFNCPLDLNYKCPDDWEHRLYNTYPDVQCPGHFFVCGSFGAIRSECPLDQIFSSKFHICIPLQPEPAFEPIPLNTSKPKHRLAPPRPETKPEPKPEPKPESKPEPELEPKSEPKPEPKPEPTPEPKPELEPEASTRPSSDDTENDLV